MKILKLAALFALYLCVGSAFATTWYVRPDGGTRYSAFLTTGQCNGLADAPYPGTGTNQACAYNDYRWLFQNGDYNASLTFPEWGWVIAGGDTVIIRGSIADGVSYRVGWPNNVSCHTGGTPDICFGVVGDPGYSPPPIPSGTSGNPTRILGGNYAACSDKTARTQLHGGFGLGAVIPLSGSSYVEVRCVDLTDFAACGRRSGDDPAHDCHSGAGGGYQDYADLGMTLHNDSTHITLDNVRLHGFSGAGILGSPGTAFVATNLEILGNANSGWNGDDGTHTTGVGTMDVTGYQISWSGCIEEYPIVDPLPYIDCRDAGTGGYGDGFGTATVDSPAPGWQVHFDQGTVAYNTQDGLDALHISGPGSSMTVTRVNAYGNQGAQVKVGGAVPTLQNAVINGNCESYTSGVPIPGRPVPTLDTLGEPCRQAGVAVFVTTSAGHTSKIQNNTIFSAQSAGIEVEYDSPPDPSCTNVLQYDNNTFVGFFNPGNGENPSPIFGDAMAAAGCTGGSWRNNSFYGARATFPCGPGQHPGETGSICGTDPLLADETYHLINYGNVALATTSSPLKGAGVFISGITTDYNGTARANPPTIGSCENTSTCPGTAVPVAANPTFSPANGYSGVATNLTISCSTTGASAYYTTGAGTPTTLYASPIPTSVTTTYRALCRAAGYTDSGINSATLTITGSTAAGPTLAPGTGYSGPPTTVTLSTGTTACTSYIAYNTTGAQTGGNLTGVTVGTSYNLTASGDLYAQVQGCPSYTNSTITHATYTVLAPTPPKVLAGGTLTIANAEVQ